MLLDSLEWSILSTYSNKKQHHLFLQHINITTIDIVILIQELNSLQLSLIKQKIYVVTI